MPPLSFPYPLKIGIDICHIPRIRSILTKDVGTNGDTTRPLTQFLTKTLTWPERQYFFDRFGSLDVAYGRIDAVSQYLAGRWAAKEACRKACAHMGESNGLHQIMILPIGSRESSTKALTTAPTGLLLRHALGSESYEGEEVKMEGLKRTVFDIQRVEGQFFEVSITHDNGIAQAIAMVPSLDWGSA